MRIDGIDDLEFADRMFHFQSRSYTYSQVTGLFFTASVTRHSVNGIPTGKTYEAKLSVYIDGQVVHIEPRTGWLGRLKAEGLEALQRANSILSQITFTYRVAPYEAQFDRTGFFDYAGLQFHKDGHIFQGGREVGSVRNGEFSFRLAPFQITLARKVEGFSQKLANIFMNKDITVDITNNRDCMLYMLKRVYGVAWNGEFIPEKRVDRERLFYETVVRFGAMLAKVDGDADPSELMQLKRFFSIDDQKLSGAARIFNEALHASLTLDSVLGPFAKEFEGAGELKESFLLGMLSVALADGFFDRREFELIRRSAIRLGMTEAAFERILATSGLSGAEFGTADGGSRSGAGSSQRGGSASSRRILHLRILGLDDGADKQDMGVAYRALVRRYHPDILMGQGMPVDEIAKAQAILVQINLAYEALMSDAA